MQMNQITKAHFVGVSGIGVSAIIRLFAKRSIHISGSDVSLGDTSIYPPGEYHDGHSATNVPTDASILIYSPAVPEHNSERMRAQELAIPQMSYPEALAFVTFGHPTIAVSGTHGKSTTTALMGKLFEAGGFDASVIVGAEVPGWNSNYRSGNGDMFIVEACEYRRHMMNLNPQAVVLTNLELDHPDYYRDLADIKQAFRDYIAKLSGEDLLIINNDDINIRDITKGFDAIIVKYGIGDGSDLFVRNVIAGEVTQSFELVWKGTSLGVFTTPLPGLYNIYNILAAVAAYLAYGGKIGSIQEVLSDFMGVGRRFEVLGTLSSRSSGAIIVSDYAHHPTALSAVVAAALLRYRGKRVLTVFRPHHRERTQKLFDEFVTALLGVPHVILVEIYDVAGRDEDMPISSRDVIAQVLTHNPRHDVRYAKDLIEAEAMVRSQEEEYDVILVVGAGDADVLAKKLIQQK